MKNIFSAMLGVLALSALAACQTTEAKNDAKSNIAKGPDNNIEVGMLRAQGLVNIEQGSSGIIYGARAPDCNGAAPDFNDIISKVERETANFSVPLEFGQLFDAGVGTRTSGSCGKTVNARAIGLTLNPKFVGNKDIYFWRDKVTVVVMPK